MGTQLRQHKDAIDKVNQIFFNRFEIENYLRLLTQETTIKEFLSYDECYRLADNYLLAMVFIYFKRAGLTPDDYTHTNFFAGLLLAHAIVEENDNFIEEILHWALNEAANDSDIVAQMETLKFLMFEAMSERAFVSRTCCEKVMKTISSPLWNRIRDAVHAGAARNTNKVDGWSEDMYNWRTSSCDKCRRARSILLNGTRTLREHEIFGPLPPSPQSDVTIQ